MKPEDMIPIDQDIEMPRKRVGNSRYNWTGMEVGGSFFVSDASDASLAGAGRSFSSYWKLGWKFATRRLTENGIEGVRIWRVK